jgi:two-component system sensor histidine kinase EvgS
LSLVEAGSGDVEAWWPSRSRPPLPAAAQARVLVIEDHPTNQAMMAAVAAAGRAARDGRRWPAGLDRLARRVRSGDHRLPHAGTDGFGFTRLLREREGRTGQPRLTVLALTASVLDDDARRCREAGMDEVLAKPLSLATLRAALLRWLPQAGASRSPSR